MISFRRFYLFVVMIFLFLGANAQTDHTHPSNKYVSHHKNYINHLRASVGIGMVTYYGDLCEGWDCYKFRPAISGGISYRYNPRFTFSGQLMYFRLSGDDAGGLNATRNLSFKSANFEVSGLAKIDLIPFKKVYNRREKFSPYGVIGIGLFTYSPRAEYQGKTYKLRPLMTEGKEYGKWSVSVPFGGGIRMKVNSSIDISAEFLYRKTFTDYIDDVSTQYIANKSFSDPVAAALADRSFEGGKKVASDDNIHWDAGHKRGNPGRKDGFFFIGFKVDYMIKITNQIHNINSSPKFRQTSHHIHRKAK